MKKTKRLTNEKGITLIALVVTIVVLLILAGISLNLVLGNNGIIEKARDAKEKTKVAADDEKKWMDQIEKDMGLITGNIDVEEVTDENPGELAGAGTEESPYLIQSIEDLIKFSQDVNGGKSYENEYVEIERDLDFKSNKSYVDPNNTELFQDYNGDGTIAGIKEEVTKEDGRGFIPIGKEVTGKDADNNYTGNFFAGKFDGNNNIIANMYINREETEETILTGLFGGSKGEVSKIAVTGNIIGKGEILSGYRITGGIIGYNGGIVKNCYSKVNIFQDAPSNSGPDLEMRRNSRI